MRHAYGVSRGDGVETGLGTGLCGLTSLLELVCLSSCFRLVSEGMDNTRKQETGPIPGIRARVASVFVRRCGWTLPSWKRGSQSHGTEAGKRRVRGARAWEGGFAPGYSVLAPGSWIRESVSTPLGARGQSIETAIRKHGKDEDITYKRGNKTRSGRIPTRRRR